MPAKRSTGGRGESIAESRAGAPSAPPTSLLLQRALPDHVAAHIRNAIFSGALSPGERVDPNAISKQLGVSPQPVREAIIALASEGLVDRPPRRATVVAQLYREDILDHYTSYGLLAGIAAERAAGSLTEEELYALTGCVDQMASAKLAQEHAGLNFRFHKIINTAGASRRLASLLRLLYRSIPSRFFEVTPDWPDEAQQHHRAILDALVQRDGAEASRLMAEHLRVAGEHAVDVLDRAGFWDQPKESHSARA